MGFDSDTFTKKLLQTAENLKLDKNKVKSKMGFRAYNSKGVDKNGAKCNMGFGRITKIYLGQTLERNFGVQLGKVSFVVLVGSTASSWDRRRHPFYP